jgi:hypothetical protein
MADVTIRRSEQIVANAAITLGFRVMLAILGFIVAGISTWTLVTVQSSTVQMAKTDGKIDTIAQKVEDNHEATDKALSDLKDGQKTLWQRITQLTGSKP